MKSVFFRAGLCAASVFFSVVSAFACGQFYPSHMLDGGDAALLQPPMGEFIPELERQKLYQAPPARACRGWYSYEDDVAEAESADLSNALQRIKLSAEEIGVICTRHQSARAELQAYLDKKRAWDNHYSGSADTGAAPACPDLIPPPELPGEFMDYWAGIMAWHRGDTATARAKWEELLGRPAAERRFKSVWAAYMLGRSWESKPRDGASGPAPEGADTDDEKALGYFKQAGALARQGYMDSLKLGEDALGSMARIHLRRREYQTAISLYLQQSRDGNFSGADSLRITAIRALEEGGASDEELVALAKDPDCRAVITTYLITRQSPTYDLNDLPGSPVQQAFFAKAARWLAAVKMADVRDGAWAEEFALVAYQTDQMEVAQFWVDRAGGHPVAQWLRAKLLLRAGKVTPAMTLLTELTRVLPVEESTNPPVQLVDNVYTAGGGYAAHLPGRQVWAELGTLRLARGDYSGALDAFLRSGYWQDAAYVAERVMTADELHVYVDSHWPVLPEGETDVGPVTWDGGRPRNAIRHLLARRLARAERYEESRAYFAANCITNLDEFVAKLDEGWNESLPSLQRGRAFFMAGRIARANGMELFGTELAPDAFIYDGQSWGTLTYESRTNEDCPRNLNRATSNELERAAVPVSNPDLRYHYRYLAASLALEAAKLMPNDTDEKARVLCEGGSWIKYQNPHQADALYKMLVRTCRHTAIGVQADAMRWFPVLDDEGNPIPHAPRVRTEESVDIETPPDCPVGPEPSGVIDGVEEVPQGACLGVLPVLPEAATQ